MVLKNRQRQFLNAGVRDNSVNKKELLILKSQLIDEIGVIYY